MRGSVYRKKQTGLWYVVYDEPKSPDGKRKQKTIGGFKLKREAEAERALIVASINEGTYVKKEGTTVEEYLRDWFKTVSYKYTPNTIAGYKNNIENHIIPAIGSLKLRNLSASDIEKFYSTLRTQKEPKKKLSETTILYIHRVLSLALKAAVSKRLINRNEAEHVANKPKRANYSPDLPTKEDVTKIIQLTEGTIFYIPVILASGFGFRRGECLGLRWADIDFKLNLISINQTVTRDNGKITFKDPKSKTSKRTLIAPTEFIELLKEHRHNQQLLIDATPGYFQNDLVNCNLNGLPIDPNFFSKYYGNFLVRNGLKRWEFHALRHWYGTTLAQSDYKTSKIAYLMGHSGEAITTQYIHLDPSMLGDYPEQFMEILFKKQ